MPELSADLQALLDRVAEGAARSCGADDAHVSLVEGNQLYTVAHFGPIGAGAAALTLDDTPGGSRQAVRERRTKIDWAREIEELLRTRYASADKVLLVCDNLNTHTKGAFYDAFDPEMARAVLSRLEFHYTPKHGSWLNIAENELSSMTRQCLKDRRFGTIEEIRKETAAWHSGINDRQRGVDWQFRIDDARVKLRSVYPKIIV